MRLRQVAVALEPFPVAEMRCRTRQDAPVARRRSSGRRLEEGRASVPLVESFGESGNGASRMPRFLLPPLDPRQRSLRSSSRRLLDTWYWW